MTYNVFSGTLNPTHSLTLVTKFINRFQIPVNEYPAFPLTT